jgi:hypothetical protein
MQFLGLFSLTAQLLSERNCWSVLTRSVVGLQNRMIEELKAMLCHLELTLLWMKGTFWGIRRKLDFVFMLK